MGTRIKTKKPTKSQLGAQVKSILDGVEWLYVYATDETKNDGEPSNANLALATLAFTLDDRCILDDFKAASTLHLKLLAKQERRERKAARAALATA